MPLHEPDDFDDPDDDADLDTPWSLDALDLSADLASVRSAWAGRADEAEAG